jgi:hypothetical protein
VRLLRLRDPSLIRHPVPARFKIDPSYDLPPLIHRAPASPAGKILGLRLPNALGEGQQLEGGVLGGSAAG